MGRSKIIIGTEDNNVKSIKRTFDLLQVVTLPLVIVNIRTPISSTKICVELKKSTHLIHKDHKKYSAIEGVLFPKKIYPLQYILTFFVNLRHRICRIKEQTLLIL